MRRTNTAAAARRWTGRLGRQLCRNGPIDKIVLAGGLTPENVAEAIRQVRPAAVDVASGVEISPGRKSLELVRAFIEAARSL